MKRKRSRGVSEGESEVERDGPRKIGRSEVMEESGVGKGSSSGETTSHEGIIRVQSSPWGESSMSMHSEGLPSVSIAETEDREEHSFGGDYMDDSDSEEEGSGLEYFVPDSPSSSSDQ